MRKLLLPLSMLFLLSFSFGGTIIVSNVNDSGMGSLRASISIANSGDTIRFSPSLISSGNTSILLDSSLVCNKELVILGLYDANDTLFLDGRSLNRIFSIDLSSSIGKNFYLDSLVIVRGFTASNGGAVLFKGGDTLIVSNSIFKNNTALNGGAIYTSGKLNFTNGKIIDNLALNNGGGVYSTSFDSTDLTNFSTSLYFSGSEISSNSSNKNGGGIYSTSVSLRTTSFVAHVTSNIIFNNCIISSNNAITNGGGIYSISNNTSASISQTSSATSKVSVTNSTLRNNRATSDGGGIYSTANNATGSSTVYGASSLSTVLITNSVIKMNTAGNNGGGIASITSNPVSNNSRGESKITIKGSKVDSNSSTLNGGGIYSYSQSNRRIPCSSLIDIEDSEINNNNGGGVYSKAISTNIYHRCNSNLKINRCSINNNMTGSGISSYVNGGNFNIEIKDSKINFNGDKGGVYSFSVNSSSNNMFSAYNSKFYGNISNYRGGAIYSKMADGDFLVSRCQFEDDSAIYGGAIYSSESNLTDIKLSRVSECNSLYSGGGIYSASKTLRINDCLMNNNKAKSGGAIFAEFRGSSNSTFIDRSTFTKNKSTGLGGALYFRSQSSGTSSLRVDRSTITNNVSSDGGGIYGNTASSSSSVSVLTLKSSIIALNRPSDITHIVPSSRQEISSEGHNIFSQNSISGNLTSDQLSVDSILLNLDTLANNGGPYLSLNPLAGSVAIDLGTPTDTSRAFNGLITDTLRDIGACENGAQQLANVKSIPLSLEIGDQIYPNPNQGFFTFKSDKDIEIKRLFISDLQGNLIKEIVPKSTTNYKINFTGASGVYLLNIITEKGKKTLKVIKK